MDLSAITLTALRYVVAVADSGHFGRAANECHVSQPTMSTQIKKLEEQLGVSLFERTSKRVRLTAAGERIVERARAIFEEVRAIGDVARGQREPLAGTFRLGVIPTLGPYLLPWLLPPLQAAFPGLRLVFRRPSPPRCSTTWWDIVSMRRWWRCQSPRQGWLPRRSSTNHSSC